MAFFLEKKKKKRFLPFWIDAFLFLPPSLFISSVCMCDLAVKYGLPAPMMPPTCPSHCLYPLKTSGPSDEGSRIQIQNHQSFFSYLWNTLLRDTWRQKVFPGLKGDHTDIWNTALWRFPNWTHHTTLREPPAKYLGNHHMCLPCTYFSLNIHFWSLGW